MKQFLPLLTLTLITLTGSAQVISNFTWDSNPVTKATVGPDASSVSGDAISFVNGKTNNGLNAGPNRVNVNLTLPGSTFNLPGIDVSVDFRREETEADFFTRTNFVFGMQGNHIRATFPITNGASFTSISSGNVYQAPNDNQFHTYRFRYDNNTGVATISVDGTNVYTYNGTAGRALYWTGAGNVTVGANMDGSATNITILDNFLVQSIPAPGTLPLKLLSFTAAPKGQYSMLNWSSTQEINVSGFTVERSSDGISFKAVKTVNAVNSFSSTSKYQYTDSMPLSPSGYYRLKMVDIDGSYTYSSVKKVDMSASTISVSCFPNPSTDYVNLRITNDKSASYVYTVSSLDGKTILSSTARLNGGAQLVSIDLTRTNAKGVLLVQVKNINDNTNQSFKIVRQ